MVVPQRRRFAPRLSFKITLPYVLLAMLLALATIYIVARAQASKVTSEFSRQVTDARVRVGDSIVQTERAQIDNVRTLARIAGLPEALRSADEQALTTLVAPFAVSQRIERIILVNSAGRPILGIASHGSELKVLPLDPKIGSWPGVAAVLNKVSDAKGDKFVDLINDQGVQVLYTSAPVYDGDTLAGALVVGTDAQTLVERWRGATLADITIYDVTGVPLATSLGADLPAGLDVAARAGQPIYREITLGSRDYGEVVAPLVLRGDVHPQFIGVAISAVGQNDMFEQAQQTLLPIFALGLFGTFLLGIMLAQAITRPITALVRAAEGVAAGNLDHELPVTTGDEIGALTASFNTMIEGLRERERMHDVFGRFVSPTVARLVLSQPLDLSGETKELTILFTDLRDFTVMSEQEEPALVIRGLNEYFQIVVEAADRFGGIVNKFGGDSTLVLFGLAEQQALPQASAEAAVRAALAIRTGLLELNERRLSEKLQPLIAGIGINTGTVMAGLIGTQRRMEYTAIGDAVNLSARIQTLNRKLRTDILISHATFKALGPQEWLRASNQGLRQFKGKSVRVQVYSIEEVATTPVLPADVRAVVVEASEPATGAPAPTLTGEAKLAADTIEPEASPPAPPTAEMTPPRFEELGALLPRDEYAPELLLLERTRAIGEARDAA